MSANPETLPEISVIVVEDETDLAEEIAFHLQLQGMQPRLAGDGEELDRLLREQSCDVVLLDLGLPGEDGVSIAQRLAPREDLRVVMLTARNAVLDRVQGFESGADVYLTKPVNMRELAAVIRRVAQRLPSKDGELALDCAAMKLVPKDRPALELTGMECKFLRLLALAENQNLSRMAIENALWTDEEESTGRRLEVMISRLRAKLAQAGLPDLVKTEWRVGYRLTRRLLVK